MDIPFADDFFEDSDDEKQLKEKKKKQEPFVPKTCTNEWFVSEDFSSNPKPSLEDCQTIKAQADLLFYRKDYEGALKKYKERLQHLCNMNNNSMLREVHGSIINCYLKLDQMEKAVSHVTEILGTTGNPFDSYIYFLAHQVHQKVGNTEECGRCLFTAITINPWYVDYWLHFFQYLQKILQERSQNGNTSNNIPLSEKAALKTFDREFMKLLLVHTEFVYRENKKSNTNSSNLKNDSTDQKISQFWNEVTTSESDKAESRELYHVMSRSANDKDVIRSHPCYELYNQLLSKPLSEAKNF
ncbi:uncharacterized protein [Clytia hemisphaerica]|uniref:uncharacterized protein n=1 Tax=Clytia hemisphaerica TaxID=252671 RepID=UPI0034D7B83B